MKLFLTKEEYLKGKDEAIEMALSSQTYSRIFESLECQTGMRSAFFKEIFKSDYSAFMDEGFEKFKWLIKPLHALLMGLYASNKTLKKWTA